MKLPRLVRRLLVLWAVIGVCALVILVLAFFANPATVPSAPDGTVVIELMDASGRKTRLAVEIADTSDEWRRGLQNRPVVERPMLFVFPSDAPRSFWMKDTLVPLDITFFRSDGSWVSSAHMEPCLQDPCPTYLSSGPARYALEVPAGGHSLPGGSGWVLTVLP